MYIQRLHLKLEKNHHSLQAKYGKSGIFQIMLYGDVNRSICNTNLISFFSCHSLFLLKLKTINFCIQFFICINSSFS